MRRWPNLPWRLQRIREAAQLPSVTIPRFQRPAQSAARTGSRQIRVGSSDRRFCGPRLFRRRGHPVPSSTPKDHGPQTRRSALPLRARRPPTRLPESHACASVYAPPTGSFWAEGPVRFEGCFGVSHAFAINRGVRSYSFLFGVLGCLVNEVTPHPTRGAVAPGLSQACRPRRRGVGATRAIAGHPVSRGGSTPTTGPFWAKETVRFEAHFSLSPLTAINR